MKKVLSVFVIMFFMSLVTPVQAEYVLPYPSYMPGNKLYKVTRILDELKGFWYFGNIAQLKYHLGLSDKYLVEAKILMEYRQFLLGVDALERSDKEFKLITDYLLRAKNEGVDVAQLKATVMEAAKKHESMLEDLTLSVPGNFTWAPEKSGSTELHLGNLLHSSLDLRISIASQAASF